MDTFGTFFKVTLFGESHGPAVGAVIDGVPPGLPIEAGDFARAILRRKTGTYLFLSFLRCRQKGQQSRRKSKKTYFNKIFLQISYRNYPSA